MILAIIERIENIKEETPFNNRYYLTEHYKTIFDELDVLLFPIVSILFGINIFFKFLQ